MGNIGTERRDARYLRDILDDLPFFDGYSGPELQTLSWYFRAFK